MDSLLSRVSNAVTRPMCTLIILSAGGRWIVVEMIRVLTNVFDSATEVFWVCFIYILKTAVK